MFSKTFHSIAVSEHILSNETNIPDCSPITASPPLRVSIENCLLFLVVGLGPHVAPLNPFLCA